MQCFLKMQLSVNAQSPWKMQLFDDATFLKSHFIKMLLHTKSNNWKHLVSVDATGFWICSLELHFEDEDILYLLFCTASPSKWQKNIICSFYSSKYSECFFCCCCFFKICIQWRIDPINVYFLWQLKECFRMYQNFPAGALCEKRIVRKWSELSVSSHPH